MDRAASEASCAKRGDIDFEQREGEVSFASTPHTHPFSVRRRVLSGEFRLSGPGTTEKSLPGKFFTMKAGREHAESFADAGARHALAHAYHAADG